VTKLLFVLLILFQLYQSWPQIARLGHALTDRFPNPTIFDNENGSIAGVSPTQYHSMVLSLAKARAEFDKVGYRVTNVERDIEFLATLARKDVLIKPRVNYFSLGLGTLVDPYLTSPTKRLNPRSFQFTWFARVFNIRYKSIAPGPSAALQPWEDLGECWCAPESGGKSMLGLVLGRKMIPQDLVVEHIPRDATLTIGSAPKDMELWVQILDPEVREAVSKAAYGLDPLEPEEAVDDYNTVRAMDQTWVRIGKFRYDIFAKSHIQTFHVGLQLESFEAPIDRVVVRVRSNWGAGNVGHVCLYRLKLHGLFAGERTEL
jgi:hypothetical protein